MESDVHYQVSRKEVAMAEEGEMKVPTEAREGMATKHSSPITSTSSPCSSPSPEFSFTISFGSPLTTTSTRTRKPSLLSRCNKALPPLAVDLAPADDIFFEGHLLPLQLFSRPPPVSPGTGSRASVDGATRCPIRGGHGEQKPRGTTVTSNTDGSTGSHCSSNRASEERVRNKALPMLSRGFGRWWRGNEEANERDDDNKRRKKKVFDVMSRVLKRYMGAVELLFSFGSGRDRRSDLRRRPYSFSGHPSSLVVGKEEWRRRRGEFSAPASTLTSPTNSGILRGAANSASSDPSSMEELQNAIQAAIAHCKNSIAMKEDMKLVAQQ